MMALGSYSHVSSGVIPTRRLCVKKRGAVHGGRSILFLSQTTRLRRTNPKVGLLLHIGRRVGCVAPARRLSPSSVRSPQARDWYHG